MKLVNYWDKYAEMHGQQKIKIYELLKLTHIYVMFYEMYILKIFIKIYTIFIKDGLQTETSWAAHAMLFVVQTV